jgi:hypothetical protein
MPAPILKDGARLSDNRFRVQGGKPIGQGQFAEVGLALPDRGSQFGSGSRVSGSGGKREVAGSSADGVAWTSSAGAFEHTPPY